MGLFSKKSSEASPEQDIAKAEQIERLIESSPIVAALHQLRERYIEQWQEAKTLDQRELAFARITVLKDFQAELQAAIDQKPFAKAHLAKRARS